MAFNLDEYETVEERLVKFWKDHANGRIETRLLEHSPTRFIVWAAIYREYTDTLPWATGLAEETISGRGVNSTSACENAETSAIGRALASAGYATKGKRPSREEMAKVAQMTKVADEIAAVKAKMTQTAGEYVPVPRAEDDLWTIKEGQPVQTMEGAVDLLKQELGATTAKDIPRCKCGKDMAWKTGTGKTGKQWGHFKCSIWSKSTGAGCDTVIWYEIGANGQWKPQEKKW
jgi:hypothetical protein